MSWFKQWEEDEKQRQLQRGIDNMTYRKVPMSDRIKSLTVALEDDISEEQAEKIYQVLLHIRGVAGVEFHVVDMADWVARVRVTNQIGEVLGQHLRNMRAGGVHPMPLAASEGEKQ